MSPEMTDRILLIKMLTTIANLGLCGSDHLYSFEIERAMKEIDDLLTEMMDGD